MTTLMKRRYRLYFDTSVWKRLGDREHWHLRRITYRFMNRAARGQVILFSPLVAREIRQTPDPEERRTIERQIARVSPVVIGAQGRALRIAEMLMLEDLFGEGMLADLTHVGYSVVGRADALVTWDRRTLARYKVRKAAQIVCRREDLNSPLIGQPEEVASWLGLRM